MPDGTPFTLGPFMVDAGGRLSAAPQRTPCFTVRWRGRSVHARLEAAADRLRMRISLGRVPSSASANADTSRPHSFALLHELPRALPADWHVGLQVDHSVQLAADAPVPPPVTATALVTELTRFLLALAPYLDLLDAAGIDASGGQGAALDPPLWSKMGP